MYDRLELIYGKEQIKSLENKTVAIIGLGGVGSYVVESLARSNIGTLILVDFDIIDISNINRQLFALHSTIGKKKINVAKERINDINPNIKVVCYDLFLNYENVSNIINNKIDFVIDAIDSTKSKEAIISECLNKNIKFISAMGTGNKIEANKFQIMDLSKTSYDPIAKILRKWQKDNKIKGKIPVCISFEKTIKNISKTIGSNAFVPASSGLLISSYVINKLTNVK